MPYKIQITYSRVISDSNHYLCNLLIKIAKFSALKIGKNMPERVSAYMGPSIYRTN